MKQGIPFYRAREIVKLAEQGYVENDLFISRELFEDFSRDGLMPEAGDIMISAVGTIGRTYIVQQTDKFYFKDASVLCLKNLHLESGYLDFYLQSSFARAQMISGSKGTTVDTITIEKANDYLIPIPPRGEQKRIVSSIQQLLHFLNRLDTERQELKRLIDNSKELVLELAVKGKLVPQDSTDEPAIELLKRINPDFKPSDNLHYIDSIPTGWVCCPLYTVCEILDSQRKPINSKEREKRVEKATTLFPYYGATGQVGVIDDYIFDGVYLLLGEDGAPFLDRYAKKAYSVSGKIWVNNHAHILKPRINALYMMCYLNAINYRPYVTGTTRLKLTQEAMRSIPILVPPLAEQERITSRIKLLFHVIDAIQLS